MASPELAARLRPLLDTPTLPALGPERRAGTLSAAEVRARLARIPGLGAVGMECRQAIEALVLLWHDHLDEAHRLAQMVETAEGSFVHAIMHRREPDYWNSKYWWRRVGAHSAFAELGPRAVELLLGRGERALAVTLAPEGRWEPCTLVDACEAAAGRDSESTEVGLLREVQRLETEVLLEWLCR